MTETPRDWPAIVEEAKRRRAEQEAEAERLKAEKAAKAKRPRTSADRRGWTEEQKRARQRQQEADWRRKHAEQRREMDRKKYARRRAEMIASGVIEPKVELTEQQKKARRAEDQRRKTKEGRARYPERHHARKLTHKAKVAGQLVEKPCCLCGSEENVEAHHRNYARPLDVTWLCRSCHKAVHRMLKAREAENDLFAFLD